MEIKKYSEETQAIVKPGEFDEEKFKGYIKAYDSMVKILKNSLTEGVDYGYPYEGAPKPVLLLPGAEKLFAYAQLEILELIDEEIKRGDEIWGYKVRMTIGREGGRKFTSVGIATYTEAKMWNTKKSGDRVERYKKDEHFLYQIAYKRAFVKAVIKAFGISGLFSEEEYEEETKEPEPENEIERKSLRKFASDLIKTHFLPPEKWMQMIDYIIERGKVSDTDCSKLINWIREREQVLLPSGEKKMLRTKERLIEIATMYIYLANEIEEFSVENLEDMTIIEIKNVIDKAREILGYKEKLEKAQKIILNQI